MNDVASVVVFPAFDDSHWITGSEHPPEGGVLINIQASPQFRHLLV
jgi:hypothetical protein